MRRKPKAFASRDRVLRRLTLVLILGLMGAAGGALIGLVVLDEQPRSGGTAAGSFADLSANPDALATDEISAEPCPGCTDSYAVAARLRAAREQAMEEPFRELGAVDIEALGESEAGGNDEYRYGGRLPDPEEAPAFPPMVTPVAPLAPEGAPSIESPRPLPTDAAPDPREASAGPN